MTDENNTEDKADGFVVVHHPADGSDAYVIGPYPPIRDLIDRVVEGGKCDCRREALPAAFPDGIVMAFDVERLMPGLVQQVAAALNSIGDDKPIH